MADPAAPTNAADPTIITKSVVVDTTTVTDASDTDSQFAKAVADHIAGLALAIDNPRTLAENTLDWVKDNFPERVYTAYWITVDGTNRRDKGIAVQIAALPWHLRMRALIGGWSAGFGVYSPDFHLYGSMKASIGVGAVVAYDKLNKLIPVASFAIRF